jgi:hypothetical protein
MRWLTSDEPGVAGGENDPKTAHADLAGTDCSDGLLRCAGGEVEASRIAHLPARCGQVKKSRSPEKTDTECACPWDPITHCRTGCGAEGVEVTGAKSDANGFQLCRPEQPSARPVLGSDDASVDVCSEASTTCRDGIVRMCSGAGQAARNVAYCIFGCAPGLSVDDEGDGPAANPDGLISILCRRSDAERR